MLTARQRAIVPTNGTNSSIMTSDSACLYFGPIHRPEGFTNAAIAQFDGSAEPVVRELLQNSLDAAIEGGIPTAEVCFVICEARREDLPGWSTYERIFQSALTQRRSRKGSKPSHDEKMVIERIQRSSSAEMTPLLVCTDNGHGLNGKRMEALLTPGNTSKGEGGAGSFGLGHHAAFGVSNLRYVLYGAKYLRDDSSIAAIASGHAILATYREGNDSLRAADGYWFKAGQEESAFDGSYDCFPESLPPLLDRFLTDVVTGTSVCITGFNDFNREDSDPSAVESICRVAAANFSDAIHAGSLVVKVLDERANMAIAVERSALGEILELSSDNRRAGRGKAGRITGQIAYSAWRTLHLGETIDSIEGVTIRWRPLESLDRQPTRVHVFRKGMWITSRAPGLISSPDFSDTLLFDAVLSLEFGPLEELVRNAEGPEHRGIDRKRLSNRQKKQYRELVAEIASLLREVVGKRMDLQDFVPDGFAALKGHDVKAAERLRRPRTPAGGGSQKETTRRGQQSGGGERERSRNRGTPRPGSRPRYRTSLRVDELTVISAELDYEEDAAPHAEMGIRVTAASGADASCEQPLPDEYLRITSITDDTGHTSQASDPEGDMELLLPAAAGRRRLTVTLAAPVPNPQLIEIDLVKRKAAIPQDGDAANGQR